jgi:Tfp pilus assembly protein PilF
VIGGIGGIGAGGAMLSNAAATVSTSPALGARQALLLWGGIAAAKYASVADAAKTAAKKEKSKKKKKKKKKKKLTAKDLARADAYRKEGEALQQQGQMRAATKKYLKAYKIQPRIDDDFQNHAFLNNLGWTLHNVDPERAKTFYRKAIAQHPAPPFPHAFLNLGDLYRDDRDLPRAIEAYVKANQIEPKVSTLGMLGQLQMWEGRLKDAVATYERGIQLDPTFQEIHNYFGQTFSLQGAWTKASKAFVNTVRHGLPTNATDCYRGHWEAMETWQPARGVTVIDLPAPRGSKGEFTEPVMGKTYRDLDRQYKLVRLRRVFLEGKGLTRLFQAAPRCMYFLGEHTASAAPGWNWGMADEEYKGATSDAPRQEIVDGPLVMLFDRRAGHGNYFHHQTELLPKALWFFREVYKPRKERKRWKNAKFLIPPGVLLALQIMDTDALGLRLPRPDQMLQWTKNDRYYAREMWTVDYSAPVALTPSKGKLGNQVWLKNAATVWELHFAPRSLLRLTRDALRSSLHASSYEHAWNNPKQKAENTGIRILYYSRRDMEKRHVEGEEKIVAALRNVFGQRSVEVFVGGIAFNVPENLRLWGSAQVVVAPHGAGLANLLMCPPDTSVVLMPSCDGEGGKSCPATADSYFGYLTSALGLDFKMALEHGPFADFFRNYTVADGDKGDDQVDAIVELVGDALERRGLWATRDTEGAEIAEELAQEAREAQKKSSAKEL